MKRRDRLVLPFVAIVSSLASMGGAGCKKPATTSNPPPLPSDFHMNPPPNPPVPLPEEIHRNPPPLAEDGGPVTPTSGALEPNPKYKKKGYEVGDSVAAKWNGASWWIATVKAKDGEKYVVLYGDGQTGTVSADEMLPVAAKPKLAMGDHVLACWKGPQMFTGVVTRGPTKAAPGEFEVKWDDGDTPLTVAAGKITPF